MSDSKRSLSRRQSKRNPFIRPMLEQLEDRTLLSTVNWRNAGGGDWDTPTNWDSGTVPTSSDDAVINLPGITVTHSLSANDLLHSISSEDPIVLSGGSLTLQATSQIDNSFNVNGATLFVNNAGLNGTGTLTNNGTLVVQNSVTNLSLVNTGTCIIRGDVFLNGTLTNAPGAAIVIISNDYQSLNRGSSSLTVAGGFTNHGMIKLTNDDTSDSPQDSLLRVTGGTLVNDGVIQALPVWGSARGGGGRDLDAQLDNQGTIVLDYSLGWNQRGPQDFNSGIIDLRGGDLSLGAFNSQASPIRNFTNTNTGRLNVGSGRTLTIYGGTFTNAGGTLGGPGTLVLYRAVTANFDTAPSLGGLVAIDSILNLSNSDLSGLGMNLSLNGSTVNSPATLYSAPGQTILTRNSTINAPLVNAGTWIIRGYVFLNGALTTVRGSTLLIISNDFWSETRGSSSLTVAGGFTNDGLIQLTNDDLSDSPQDSLLAVTGGTLVNAPDGVIQALPVWGSARGGGGRDLDAQLDNQGTILLDYSLGWNQRGPQDFNSGIIDLRGGDLSFGALNSQASPTRNFTNTRTLNIQSGRTLTMYGGTYSQSLTGSLQIDLGGIPSSGHFGKLNLLGAAALDGTLQVNIVNGYLPQAGDQFIPMSFASRMGTFSSITSTGVPSSLSLKTLLTDTNLIVSFVINDILTATGGPVGAREGIPFGGQIATFTDTNPNGTAGYFTATITWGDGTSNNGTISGSSGSFTVTGSHTYTEEGSNPVQVSIVDGAGDAAQANSTATVADASLAAKGIPVSAIRGYAVANMLLATFTDADPNGSASDYSATVNWGDADTTAAINITADPNVPGQFDVTASKSHPYSSPGGFNVQVQILDQGGASAGATSLVTVTPTPTSTTLISSVNPSILNQPITLTATITAISIDSRALTGAVQFQADGLNLDSPVPLSGKSAALSISSLLPGPHVITALYSGDSNFLMSSASLVQSVHYIFSGFLAPLNQNLSFGLGRSIQIKFQLTDFNGAFISNLSAVSSLQVSPVNSNGTLGTPFNPTSAGNTGLQYDPTANQYIFNWQTKGLAAGSYEILLSLKDGTTKTKVLQLTATGKAAGLLAGSAGAGSFATAGALLAGDVELYVNDPNSVFTADELARIQDAIASADAVVSPYGVTITDVTDGSLANVILDTGSTSAVGGYGDGVLGCTTDAGEITIIQGWNWYAGSDPMAIGAGQYDFETVVTHELGHALGLGHSANAASVMYTTLTTGTTNRALAVADLNVPDSGTGGACGLHAASNSNFQEPNPNFQEPISKNQVRSAGNLEFGSWFLGFGILVPAPAGNQTQPNSATAREAPLYAVLSDWTPAADFPGEVARLLNVKETMRTTSHSQAGLTERAGDDDFWSVIGITAAWDQIIK